MNKHLPLAFLTFLFICFPMAASSVDAATLSVTKTDDTVDNICDADCSLRDAVSAANDGDTITFGTQFNSPNTITLLQGQILIAKSLTIAGPGSNTFAISGNNAGRIFNISSGAVVSLSGMTLRDGRVGANINDVFGGAIYMVDSTLTLTNMTLSNNTARFSGTNPPIELGFGGAIAGFNSTGSIINSTISNNSSRYAGGIYSNNGIVNVTNSTLSSNTGTAIFGQEGDIITVIGSTFSGNSGNAVSGSTGRISIFNSTLVSNSGGISNESGGIITVDRSIISNNQSITFAGGVGGGVSNKGIATITNTLISNNRISGKGGGIFNTGTMYITSSAVTNNSALESGGGIFNAIGQLLLTNSTVSGNVADFGGASTSPGGGIYNLSDSVNPGGKVILTNSTIANNRAAGKGGGLRQDATGSVIIRNTIIAANSSNTNEIDVSGTIVSQGFNLIGNTTGSFGWMASDLLNQNPLLAPLGNNGGLTLTHALMAGSPAINAGSNALARDPSTNLELVGDQRGSARFIGGGTGVAVVDIGAFESNIANSLVALGGRVLTSAGRGVDKARITLTDTNGIVTSARTSSFGYYRFVNLQPGNTYTISVVHKLYQFNSPQTVTVDNNRNDLNFVASP